MEMKVWLDGIQRVICGVDEHTTCHDLILALAHATGRTGRFTMIEKWRGKERRLSPTDNPVRILQKWGEYSTDIQFILRHSSSGKRPIVLFPTRGPVGPILRTSQPGEIQSSLEAGGKLHKSRTFSGAHASHFVFKPHAKVRGIENDEATSSGMHDVTPVQASNSVESSEQSSMTSRSSASISPYPSLERRLPRRTITGFESLPVEQLSLPTHKGFVFKNKRSPLTFVDNFKSDNDAALVALVKPNKLTSVDVNKKESTVDLKSRVTCQDLPVKLDRMELQFGRTGRSFESEPKTISVGVPGISDIDTPVTGSMNGVVHRSLLLDHAVSKNVQNDSKSNLIFPGSKLSSVIPKTSATNSTSSVVRSSSSETSQHYQSSSKLVESTPMTNAVKSQSSRFLVNNSPSSHEDRASDSSQSSIKNSERIAVTTVNKISDDDRSTRFADARANFLNREAEEVSSTQERHRLVELCREQKEELREYESELNALQTAISAAQEASKSSETQRQTAISQIEELDKEERLIDAELMDLELVSWEDKRDIEQQRLTRMTTELTLLKTSVARSDKDIARLEESNRHLTEEIDFLTHQHGTINKTSNLKNDEEQKVLDDLRSELVQARSKTVHSKELLTKETKEVVIMQQCVTDKQSTLDTLQQVLKEANLNLFKSESVHSSGELNV